MSYVEEKPACLTHEGNGRYPVSSGVWLSQREYDSCKYWLAGFSSSEIAEMLGLSPKTVQSYLEKAKIKLSCNKKSELFARFIHLFQHVFDEWIVG